MQPVNLIGLQFGRLTVMSRAPSGKKGARWHCACECGASSVVARSNLITGATKSCGCLLREMLSPNATTHGKSKTPEYYIWNSMRERCNNHEHKSFPSYGGRGIVVCERWQSSFENFISDMGERPSPRHTIDRYPDNDGNYELTNCRWATMQEQNNNRRSNHMVVFQGKRQSLADAARAAGMDYGAVGLRIFKGWDVEKALNTPIRKKRPNGTHPSFVAKIKESAT